MYTFSFVILHYITLNDTIKCIESILKNINYLNYYIIVVDNGSKNNSGNILKEKYKNNFKVKVILNENNLGFARGNNVGYKLAKYELCSDFIAIINNDTMIRQIDFVDKIIEKYKKNPYHILGPDIISLVDGQHQNPRLLTLQNSDVLKKLIKQYKISLFINYLFIDKIAENIKKILLKKPFINTQHNLVINTDNREMTNVKLHGSALIFSQDYINNYEGFYPGTFMYSEESILYYIAQRDNLTTIYYPEVRIYHKEDSSTNALFKKDYKKRRFYYKNFIRSGKILLDLLRENSTE